MAILNNKILQVFNENQDGYENYLTVNKEIYLTTDLIHKNIFDGYNFEYNNALVSPICLDVIRVIRLNEDETIQRDISYCIKDDWNIDFERQQGGWRSGSITLINSNKEWLPNPVNGTIWKGTKFKIYVGIYYNGVVYWRDCGIFVGGNISVSQSDMSVSVPLYDKFALLDGTIGGKRNEQFRISSGTTIKAAIELCLTQPKNSNDDIVYDNKPIIFPIGDTIWNNETVSYLEIKTPYTINKDAGYSMGEIIIELAEMLSLDVFYNENGNLTLVPGIITNDDFQNYPVAWIYEDNKQQYSNAQYEIDFSNIITEILVAGAIENGNQYKARLVNSLKSQVNPYLTEPNPEYIEDSKLLGDESCMSRAKYEMINRSRLGIQLSFDSLFIPHLQVDNVVIFNSNELNLVGEKFVVNKISFNKGMTMSLSLSNLNEVFF